MRVMESVIEKVKELEALTERKKRSLYVKVDGLASMHCEEILKASSISAYMRHYAIYLKLRQWRRALK
ncbi:MULTISPECIES: hypothetical protein [Gammaproteobacteria]|uniref:hypothetical protein n=1 Tax=Gammaproteobacteria TaxID=1236 RepID=UPI002FCB9C8A